MLVSYYDRYAGPLLGLKVLLVVWAADAFQATFLVLAQKRRPGGKCGPPESTRVQIPENNRSIV